MDKAIGRLLVFTDLDGSLLNKGDYSYEMALPAIEMLRKHDVPLIMVSSKTQAEMKTYSERLCPGMPYVCENGSIIVYPPESMHLSEAVTGIKEVRDSEVVINRGQKRTFILKVLENYRKSYSFLGFNDMTTADVVQYTGLSMTDAEKANSRLASEPLVWNDSDENRYRFEQSLGECELKLLKGGRFYHVMGNVDKADAVKDLKLAYQAHYASKTHSIVIGDSDNDKEMLVAANTAIIIPGTDGSYLQLAGHECTVYAPEHGAAGWAIAVQEILDRYTELKDK